MRSKALKHNGKEHSKLYLWWIDTDLADSIYKFQHKYIDNPIFQIKRLWDWYWNVFKDDYDFDGHCLFAIIGYKLKRIEKVLHNGHAIQEEIDLKAIRIAIKLAERLAADNYGDRAHRKHDAKWGEIHTWFEPCNDGTTNSYWKSSRPKAITDVDKEEELEDYRATWKVEMDARNRDEKQFYGILQKYLRNFWD